LGPNTVLARASPAASSIGLDIGTSSVKGLLLAEAGHVLGRSQRGYPLDVGDGGRIEVDPDRVVAAAEAVIRRLSVVAEDAGSPVSAIAASGSGDEAVWLDAGQRAVGPVPMALDTRSQEQALALARAVGLERLYAITGLPPAPMYPLVRLLWLRATDPARARRVRRLLAWPEFLALRLGLEPVAEPSLAGRTLAFDIHRRRYDEAILEAAGAPRDLFAPIAPTGSVVGRIRPAIASRLGLRPGALLVAGGFDQAMAALGAGIVGPGPLHVGTGTWEAATGLLGFRPRDDTLRRSGLSIGPSVAASGYTVMGSSAGGILPAWLGRLGGWPSRAAGAAMVRLAARAPDRPTGLLVLPHLEGSYTPWLDPGARGVIAGLGLASDAATLARAVLEGVTFELRGVIEQLRGAGIEVTELRATGGGARSRTWLQLKADITGLPVLRPRPSDAGALAAACMAACAVGSYASPEAAVAATISIGSRIEPRPAAVRAYAEIGDQHRALYPALRAWRVGAAMRR
jgi:xylulokinase